MKQQNLHHIPMTDRKAQNITRLRHLKYARSINCNVVDFKTKKMSTPNNLSFKKQHFSLKGTNKLEISQSQSRHTLQLSHLFRFAKNLKKVSFLQIYNPLFTNPKDKKTKSLLLTQAKNLKSLGFSYEIQDPHFSDYERFYNTVLVLNGNSSTKQTPKVMSENICATLQNLNVVLPRDIVFVVDFRVSNETLDNPPINRLTHSNENYVWNLAASYFTLNNIENSYAYKYESLLDIRKIFLSCDASNSSFECFKQFLDKLSHIDTLHFQLKKTSDEQLIFFKDLTSIFKTNSHLKNLIIDCEEIAFDPIEFEDIEFPKELTSLHLNLKNTEIKSMDNFYCLEQFPIKLEGLEYLKILKLGLPTTFLMNQMIHNMPSTLKSLEILLLDFPENSQAPGDEDIYVNSLLEVVSTMPMLKELYVRTDKLNYTYCAYLSNENMPTGLKRIQWIDETLGRISKVDKNVNTKQWIECKKFEDFNIIMRLLTENLEYLEIPFVFDGIESEFVALRFLEVFARLQKVKVLNLSLGFKTLDESNVETITNFISKIKISSANRKDFNMNLNIYYRKIKGDLIIDDCSRRNIGTDSKYGYCVQYIHDVHC